LPAIPNLQRLRINIICFFANDDDVCVFHIWRQCWAISAHTFHSFLGDTVFEVPLFYLCLFSEEYKWCETGIPCV
jgi:hypothetical protein